MAREVEWRLSDFSLQQVANAAWAYATAGRCDEMLFRALARAVEWRYNEFKMQGFANTSWASATAGHFDDKLLAA